MADSNPAPRIQFGEDIQPVKTNKSATVYSKAHDGYPSSSEKSGAVDVEDRAVQIANEDLNKKNKQVSPSAIPFDACADLIPVSIDLHGMDVAMALVSIHRCDLWRYW